MKGDAQPLIKFFDGSDKRFIIPLYQRNYDWKEDNCEQLFQDLMKLHDSDRKSHFFDMPQGLVLDTQLIVAPKNANPKKSMR